MFLATWKEKTLDYEIETKRLCSYTLNSNNLKRKDPRLRDWNKKKARGVRGGVPLEPWKEKTLDYEIETRHRSRILCYGFPGLEKKRPSITRLKLNKISKTFVGLVFLKRKDPRLRDWNLPSWRIAQHGLFGGVLEKKRPSITRLKRWRITTRTNTETGLEKKRPSITRLKRR